MKPVDFRNETFASLRQRIEEGVRADVLRAWQMHGPGTTEEVAERSEISILSFRPRSTELFQLGYICLCDEQTSKTEGRYRARMTSEHIAWFAAQQREATNTQREFPLGL